MHYFFIVCGPHIVWTTLFLESLYRFSYLGQFREVPESPFAFRR